VLAQHFPGKC